jgi:hypothetical protein
MSLILFSLQIDLQILLFFSIKKLTSVLVVLLVESISSESPFKMTKYSVTVENFNGT